MRIIKDITEDNARDYFSIIPEENLFDIGREYTRGIVSEDEDTGELCAGIIWELKNVEDEKLPTAAEIQWFYAFETEAGEEILNAFEQNASQRGAQRTFYEMPEMSSQEQTSLESCGYTVQKAESTSIYVTVEDLMALKLPSRNTLNNIKSISELSSKQFKAGIMNCVYHKRYGLLDDLPFLSKSRYDPDISSCAMVDDKVGGFLLVHMTKSGTYRPELFFAVEPDSSFHLLNMLRFSIRAASEAAGADGVVQVKRYNEATVKLSAKLFPGKKGDTVIRAVKKIH